MDEDPRLFTNEDIQFTPDNYDLHGDEEDDPALDSAGLVGTEWDSYEHILASEEGAIPIYGVQILTFMTPDGRQHTRWCVDGSPEPDLLIGTMERVQFFVHVQNLDVVISDEDEEME